MGAPDLELIAGDIVRGRVSMVDDFAQTCVLDTGGHGGVVIPLAGMNEQTLAYMTPGAVVCAQVREAAADGELPKASVQIELASRSSVVMLHGCAIMDATEHAQARVLVSPKVDAEGRHAFVEKIQGALEDVSTGLQAMLGVVRGPVQVFICAGAQDLPWSEVMGNLQVQLTEAAALTVVAGADKAPALIMSEKTDADGDASITFAAAYADELGQIDGHREQLMCGGQVFFERTESMWCAHVSCAHAHESTPAKLMRVVNTEAARYIGGAILEYDMDGLLVIDFAKPLPSGLYAELTGILAEDLECEGTRISGDESMAVALIRRGLR